MPWLALIVIGSLEQGCFKDPYHPPFLVELSRQDSGCIVTVGGHGIEPAALVGDARESGAERAIVITGKDVPGSCLKSTLEAVHRGGLSSVEVALRVS